MLFLSLVPFSHFLAQFRLAIRRSSFGFCASPSISHSLSPPVLPAQNSSVPSLFPSALSPIVAVVFPMKAPHLRTC